MSVPPATATKSKINELQAQVQQARERLAELEVRWDDEKKRVEEIRTLSRKLELRYQEERRRSQATAGRFNRRQSWLRCRRNWSSRRAICGNSRANLRSCKSRSMPRRSPRSSPAGRESRLARCWPTRSRRCSTSNQRLEERVIGQSHALEAIAQRIRTARANLTDPRRPIGVFLLVGSSGVGKTETALALADTLYGGERNLITINMSEYQEAHTVSGLRVSPGICRIRRGRRLD